jgi:hypothetical protein
MEVLEKNPFIVRRLARGRAFADREVEVARMVAALRDPGSGLVVFGPRRMGKSSALERAAEAVRSGGGHAAVATLATATDPADAARRVLEAIHAETGRRGWEIIEAIAGRLKAGITVVPSMVPGGLPSIRFEFGLQESVSSRIRLLPDVLTAVDAEMKRRDLVLGLGLDEFQRIHEWGGEDAEWALRDAIQRQEAIGYVLAGSQRGLIEAMVGDRGRAFWKLFDPMEFGPIDDEVLAEWIHQEASAAGVNFELAAADRIVALARPRTRDVVQLARETWARAAPSGTALATDAEHAFEAIVDAQAALYHKLWMDLSAAQQRVLRVVATDAGLPLTAKATLDRYGLGPKSTAHRSAEALVEREHLVNLGRGRYLYDDPFFARWVQRYTLEDIGEPVPPLTGADGDRRVPPSAPVT